MAFTDMTTPPDNHNDDDDDKGAGPSIHSPYTGSNPPPPNPGTPASGGQAPAGITFQIASQSDDGDDDVTDYLINYNERFAQATPALFRNEVVDQTIAVLISKAKPNPLLVGAPGVGKTHIVEDIARRIEAHDVPISFLITPFMNYPCPHFYPGHRWLGSLKSD